LVSGPPGIGKTTAIRLIAKTMGFELIEQNASDVRNKNAVHNMLHHLTDNTLINRQHDHGLNKVYNSRILVTVEILNIDG
jgi:replication factor C subunit 1